MTKVWIAEEGEYSDRSIMGIFSTRQKAEQYAADRKKQIVHGDDPVNVEPPKTVTYYDTKRNKQVMNTVQSKWESFAEKREWVDINEWEVDKAEYFDSKIRGYIVKRY